MNFIPSKQKNILRNGSNPRRKSLPRRNKSRYHYTIPSLDRLPSAQSHLAMHPAASKSHQSLCHTHSSIYTVNLLLFHPMLCTWRSVPLPRFYPLSNAPSIGPSAALFHSISVLPEAQCHPDLYPLHQGILLKCFSHTRKVTPHKFSNRCFKLAEWEKKPRI